jgi:hypothetical protein
LSEDVQERIEGLNGGPPPCVLTFYIPNERYIDLKAISEVAIINGTYTAKQQGLLGYKYFDNWRGTAAR